MKEMKLLYLSALLVMLHLCSCTKEKPSVEENCAISIMPIVDKETVVTRASLYGSENDLRKDIFHTYTYLSGTSTLCFGSDVKYSSEDIDASKHRWLFYGGGAYRDYYWPLAQSLDFFAYAPVDNGYVTVDSSVNPPSFTATLPLTNAGTGVNQENIDEFMYAYTYDRDKSGGVVPLAFHHPFAAIVFKVSQSQRDLTVNSISIGGIKYVGTCSFDEQNSSVPVWNIGGGADGEMTLSVGKIIPGDVNFGGELCGPYLVLPQENTGAGKDLEVECHWRGYDTESDDIAADTKILTGKITNDWEPSKIYTYTLDLGNSREEILFKVSVTPWEYVYEHEFEIE